MKIKVCGMKYPDNIEALSRLPIDYMGLIFYDKSPRMVEKLTLADLNILPTHIKRTGVFVKATIDFINEKISQYNLDAIQLHGNESPDFCNELNGKIPVIKAFSISSASDFLITKDYEIYVQYFLFDTKTPQYGGSGEKFDWNILKEYEGETPFFLSGGISAQDVNKIKEIKHPGLYAVDLNSRFETQPGLKDIELLNQFIKQLNDEQD